MLNKRLLSGFAPFIFVMLLAALLLKGLWREPVPTSTGLVNQALPDFNLPDLLI